MSETNSCQGFNGRKSREAATCAPTVILDLNPNDVLLGRGTGTAVYEGNVKFRILIKEYKEQYMSDDTTRHTKAVIANRVVNIIRSRGGRFVRKVKEEKARGVANREVYHEAEEEVALEKCKQALRQQHGWGERRCDGSNHPKRTVQPIKKPPDVQPTSTPSLNHERSISSQFARLQMNQLRRVLALQSYASRPSIDSSVARMILLRRAQIAAQNKDNLYKHILTQMASEESIRASLPVVDRLNEASAPRQATSSYPQFASTQPRAVPQSLLEDLAAFRLYKNRNESRQLRASAAVPETPACTNLCIPSGRMSTLGSEQSPTTKESPSSEPLNREDAAAALSVLAMAAEHRTSIDQRDLVDGLHGDEE
jgi:uncharacterized protein (DUF2132 family)